MTFMDIFTAFAIIGMIYIIIGVMWALAEKIFYGKRTPRVIDDFVALFLAVTLYMLFWT